jgi:D-alanyl-D-alanine carboxypeptidase (penicillin-binding protein 5/6)
MTAYAASFLLSPQSVVTIDQADADLTSSGGLTAGERFRFDDLMAFTLVSSSNGGAAAIARTAGQEAGVDFIKKMNDLAAGIGLKQTVFRNETGLDIADGQLSGSFSTAREIAKLLAFIEHHDPEILSGTDQHQLTVYSLDNAKHSAVNTNSLIGNVNNILASKTGTTDLAGGNLAMVIEPTPGRKVAIVVLGSTLAGRFDDAYRLIRDTRKYFADQP